MLGEPALSFERKHSVRRTSVAAVTFPDNLLRHAGVVTEAVLVAEHRIRGPQLGSGQHITDKDDRLEALYRPLFD